ncbi:MAG: DUF5686 family protein [Bacteroidota bacterium]
MHKYLLTLFLATTTYAILAQQTIVTGKVTEAGTGAPVPFANVVFTGTTDGAIADFDGNFIAKTKQQVDSIEVRYVGYITKAKPLVKGEPQTINFQLEEDVLTLQEVVVTPGENPAWAVMRNVVKNKKSNDKRKLEAYEYESYTRTEFDIDNISKKFAKRKFMREAASVLDSIERIAGEDGKPILPVFISEAISRVYYKRNPVAKHEHMIKTRVSGVGITDGSLTSQLIGSSFQEYNFYQNWLNITSKEFISPIADGWKLVYEYELVDSLFIGGDYCYKLEFNPKQEKDLAFYGTMWITKEGYALKQIDATIDGSANVNFIEKIKIQQELAKMDVGAWLPAKNRVIIDIKPVSESTAGFIAKFYVSNKDFVVNEMKEDRLFMNPISMDDAVRVSDNDYWIKARHDSLTSTEQNVFLMIDSLKKIPTIKRITDVTRVIATGHFGAGPIDIGPYTTFFGNNDIEGIRLGLGARTNIRFSNKWVFGGYLGYGLKDERLKYNFYTYHILDRNQWTQVKYEQQKEVDQVWLLNDNVDAGSLFYSFSRFGNLTQPFLRNKYRLSFSRQLSTGLNAELSLKREEFTPLFNFTYFIDNSEMETQSAYQTAEANVSIRYGRDEIIVTNDNKRLNLGSIRRPVYEINYTYGADAFNSDFSYHKLKVSVEKRQKLGLLGVSNFRLGGGYIFGDVPYTLGFNPIGNESPVFADFAFNQMNFFEFSSDRFVEFRYRHSFEGMLFNRIPLLRKLKWRALISSNVLLGDLSDSNIAITPFQTDMNGETQFPFRRWENKPYVEVGYGIENILKLFTIQAFHRLTYLDGDVNRFGIKGSIALSF